MPIRAARFRPWIGASDHTPIVARVQSKTRTKEKLRQLPLSARTNQYRQDKARDLYDTSLPQATGEIWAAETFDQFQKAYESATRMYIDPWRPMPRRNTKMFCERPYPELKTVRKKREKAYKNAVKKKDKHTWRKYHQLNRQCRKIARAYRRRSYKEFLNRLETENS